MVRALLVVVLAAPFVSAQATHVVGPGGFAQIRSALAVAQAGDAIEVQPGTYAQFDCSVGVTIRAVAQPVTIAYDPTFAPGCAATWACQQNEGATRFAIPAG